MLIKPEITPEMVEVAARAIRERFSGRSARAKPWNALPLALRDSYRAEARDALTAALQVESVG